MLPKDDCWKLNDYGYVIFFSKKITVQQIITVLVLGHPVVMGETNTCLCGNYIQMEKINKLQHMRRKVVLRKVKRVRRHHCGG